MTPPEPSPPAAANLQSLRWVLALLLLAVCVAVFRNAAHSGLTYDDKYFTPNEVEWSLRAVAQLFSEDAWAATGAPSRLYRPLMWLLLWVEGSLHGPQPIGFHITCIALHAAATLILFFVLIDLLALARHSSDAETSPHAPSDPRAPTQQADLADLWAAVAAALIFAVHPIHTEAINSIFNRSEILATLGVLLALRLIVRSLLTAGAGIWSPSPATWIGLALIYLASLLCRESALSLPALLALVLVALRPDLLRNAAQRRRLWPALLCAIVPLVIYLVLRSQALALRGGLLATLPSAATPTVAEGPHSWLSTGRIGPALCMLREGLRLLLYPTPLRASYDTMPGGGALHAGIFHLLILGSALLSLRRAPGLVVGLLFFYVALGPSTRPFSGEPISSQMAERFLYLPSVGLAIALASVARAVLLERSRHAQIGLAMAVLAVAALFSTWTVRRNADWSSSLALWQAELQNDPRSVTAVRLLSAAQIESGQSAAAATLCDTYLPQMDADSRLQNHCAIAYDNTARPRDAEAAYRRAVTLGLGSVAHANLARLLERTGRSSEAQAQAELAVAAETDPARRHYRRGLYILRYHPALQEEAAEEFRRALAIQPRFRAAQVALASLPQTPNR